jgi:MYXO-CTERM domain-containing protein
VTANANATVTETIPAGVSLVAVVADPQLPGFSANLAPGVVTVPMDKALSTTYVTFTNQAAPTATPTRTATATATGTVATATPTATGTLTTATPTATATVPPTGCILGDINCDGIVDIRDYGVWRQNFGQTTCGNPADLNTDCIVDIRDYGIWRANFGRTAGAAPRGTPGPAFVAGAPAVEASGHLLRAEDPGLAVPVLPLVGGLLGLGGLAGWRRRRPPSDRE